MASFFRLIPDAVRHGYFLEGNFFRWAANIRRHRPRRRADLLEPAIAAEIDLLFGWSAVAGGYFWLFLSLVAVLMVLVPLGSYLGVWSRDEQNYSLFYERGPRLDMGAFVIAAL